MVRGGEKSDMNSGGKKMKMDRRNRLLNGALRVHHIVRRNWKYILAETGECICFLAIVAIVFFTALVLSRTL